MTTDEVRDPRYQDQVAVLRAPGPQPDVTYIMSADEFPTDLTDVEIHIGWER